VIERTGLNRSTLHGKIHDVSFSSFPDELRSAAAAAGGTNQPLPSG
jgi:hypothetical protein